MVREAEAHAEEDKRRKELVEARNQADAAIYADTRGETEQAITTLKEAMKSEDVQRIRQTTERLTQVAMRLAQAAQSAGATTGAQEDSRPSGESDVIDAEFEEVDKRDRKAG